MKKLMIVMLMLGATLAASAQRHVPIRGHGHYIRPRVSVGIGFGYPAFPYGYYSPYYGYPYGPAYGYSRPSRLNLQIQEIKNDYRHLIRDARHDKSVSRSNRRAKISSLKHDRDEAVIQAQKDYYDKQRQRRR